MSADVDAAREALLDVIAGVDDAVMSHLVVLETAIRAEAGTLDWLTLAFRKAELDWPERPELAYAGLRTAIRARLAGADHE